MEWFWALFSAFCTAGLLALSKHCWTVPTQWRQSGISGYGLSPVKRDENPVAFEAACSMTKLIGAIGFGGSLFGIAMTISWIVKAL